LYCVSAVLLNFPASLPLAPELVTVMPEVTYGTAVKESLGVPADVPVAYHTASTGDMGLGVNGTFVPLSSTRFLMVFTGQLTSRMWRRISSSLLVLFQHILIETALLVCRTAASMGQHVRADLGQKIVDTEIVPKARCGRLLEHARKSWSAGLS